ncbi:putative M14 family peptidase (fragment) [Flavobacterium psychrophilum]
MNDELQKHIPNQVGRFDDSFNINCIGDMFQSLNVPTILFEAGHYQGDYEREETRKYIFVALLSGLQFIYNNNTIDDKTINYLNIPQNKVSFVDFIYRNFSVNYKSLNIITTFAAQFKEILINDKIVFEAYFTEIEDEMTFFGHQEYDGKKGDYSDDSNNFPEIGKKANFCLNKSIKFVNGLIKTQ